MITQEEEQHNHTNVKQSSINADDRKKYPARPTGRTADIFLEEAPSQDDLRLVSIEADLAIATRRIAAYEADDALRQEEFDRETKRLQQDWDDEQNRLCVLELEPTPLLLTRGVQSTQTAPAKEQKTVIDWLTFTANESVLILKQFVDIIIPNCIFINEDIGTQGYKYRISITLSGERLGMIAYGGTTPKNMLCLTGNGTAKVSDWSLYCYWINLLADYSISQIHLALDDYEGRYLNHTIVCEAYKDGKFKSTKARTNPSIEEKGIITGAGVNKGRTRNIGKSKGCAKSFTGYEKGLEQFFQLFGKLPENEQNILIPKLTLSDLAVPDLEDNQLDISILNWYRGEVKFHNNDIKLSLDMIENRDSYYAGAYPFCGEILPMVEKKIPERLPTALEVALEEMYLNLGNSYGSSVFTALSIANNDGKDLKEECVKIVQKIIKHHGRLNQKIIKNGGLDHILPFDPADLETP